MTVDDLEDHLRQTLQERASQIDGSAELPFDLRHRISARRRRRLVAVSSLVVGLTVAISGAAVAANRADDRQVISTTDRSSSTAVPSSKSMPVIPPPPLVSTTTEPSTASASMTPTTTEETTTLPSSPPQCTEVVTTFEAIGSLTGGQSAGAFWVRNIGRAPCVLHGELNVYLADTSGQVLTTLHRAAAPETILLAPNPAEPTNPPTGDVAYFAITWHELDVANGGGACPRQPVTPARITVNLDNEAVTTIDATPKDGSGFIKACNGEFGITRLLTLN